MKIFIIVSLFLSIPTYAKTATSPQDSILNVLDQYIENSHLYVEEKEDRILKLGMQTHIQRTDLELYKNYSDLFEEYKSYKYDSAYIYANKSLKLAKEMKNPDFVILSKTKIAFCLVSSGLFKEAFDIVHDINLKNASKTACNAYYSTYSRLYYDLADFTQNSPFQIEYIKQGGHYTDSLLLLLPSQSAEYQYAAAQQQMKEYRYDEAKQTFNSIQDRTDIDIHTHAIVSSCLGWIYLNSNQHDKAIHYLAKAAIDDIRSGTKETTALCTLARLLYEQGDINRAILYVRYALKDANFYNARHRKIEVGALLPIIEQERFDIVTGQRNTLIVSFLIITTMFILLLIATIIIYKQIKKLRAARNLIENRNQELQDTNLQLSEANNIKDEYIGNSFYTNAEYVNKMENLYKLINRKIMARQFDDLKQTFNINQINKERESMYTAFDETFLKLFPNFVSAYNELFPMEKRTTPDTEKSLTPEMRIFALIRLGITKPERIAHFLNYSVNTINTYKNRVKNKSLISNEQFESKIMEIGSTS